MLIAIKAACCQLTMLLFQFFICLVKVINENKTYYLVLSQDLKFEVDLTLSIGEKVIQLHPHSSDNATNAFI
jgi:hypothetical protein